MMLMLYRIMNKSNSVHVLLYQSSTRGKGDEKMGCPYCNPVKTSTMSFQDRPSPMAVIYNFSNNPHSE